MKTFTSGISGKKFPVSEKIPGTSVRQSMMSLIQKDNPNFSSGQYLALSELDYYREKYISTYLTKEMGELSDLEKTVLKSLNDNSAITRKINKGEKKVISTGQRIADKVASFGGSWTFIISFGVFLLIWVACNAFLLANKGFDPYPFILLNLILSCLAAMQAPVIMMSQNRQEEKDRDRSKKDYMINLKSELELRMLHEKIDHLITIQQKELIEIQKVQIEMLNDILKRMEKE